MLSRIAHWLEVPRRPAGGVFDLLHDPASVLAGHHNAFDGFEIEPLGHQLRQLVVRDHQDVLLAHACLPAPAPTLARYYRSRQPIAAGDTESELQIRTVGEETGWMLTVSDQASDYLPGGFGAFDIGEVFIPTGSAAKNRSLARPPAAIASVTSSSTRPKKSARCPSTRRPTTRFS